MYLVRAMCLNKKYVYLCIYNFTCLFRDLESFPQERFVDVAVVDQLTDRVCINRFGRIL